MSKLFWVFHVLLTLAFGLVGIQKVLMPIPDLIAQGMWWVESFQPWQVRAIGALEVAGILGLNLPLFVKALPRILSPLASLGLAMTMVGAIITHIARQDPAPSIVITFFLFVMAATLTYHRRGEFNKVQPALPQVA
jgi:hypothetical protein